MPATFLVSEQGRQTTWPHGLHILASQTDIKQLYNFAFITIFINTIKKCGVNDENHCVGSEKPPEETLNLSISYMLAVRKREF